MEPLSVGAALAYAAKTKTGQKVIAALLSACGCLLIIIIAFMVGAGTTISGHTGPPGRFLPGVELGLNAEQLRNAEISLTVADELEVNDLARLAMVVSALGESMFRVIPNGAGSGYCGVFQAHPTNIACDNTREQARRFFIGGKGFQAGGAIYLSETYPSMSPGTIATKVEASGEPGSFYDAHQPLAKKIIAAWQEGAGSFPSEGVDVRGVGSASVQKVLNNPRLHFTEGQRKDLASGGIDERILAVLNWMGDKYDITITSLRWDHKPGSNHTLGRAIDIGAVNFWICGGGRNDPCAKLVRELVQISGVAKSTEFIYCWDPDNNTATDPGGSWTVWAQSDHCDHIHWGYDTTYAEARARNDHSD